jgi:site-specific DNA recombinase
MSKGPSATKPSKRLDTAEKTVKRCAIYARVSSSENEGVALNAIDAQIEACKQYIKAQRGMGWELVEHVYADDGYSGGDSNRPALRLLIKDMEAGKIDAVVIQRLDRLSRSVKDMCDLLPAFTIPGISLISISQSLDSETSMGRLAIHLLTSFGQFERELAGERTREKIAIARANGRWQANGVPLGYALNAKQELQVDTEESLIVQDIFRNFIKAKSIGELLKTLSDLGYRTKVRISKVGNKAGGNLFDSNALYRVLNNRMYVGEAFYNNEWHQSRHQPIIDRELWEQAHAALDKRARRKGKPTQPRNPLFFPLGDRLYWHDGRQFKMFETNERSNGKRYRCYLSPATAEEKQNGTGPPDLPTSEVHAVVIPMLRNIFRNPDKWLAQQSEEVKAKPEFEPSNVNETFYTTDIMWSHFRDLFLEALVYELIERVTFYPDKLQVDFDVNGFSRHLQANLFKKKIKP